MFEERSRDFAFIYNIYVYFLGRHGDVVLSAIVSALLCIQLGSGPEVESLFSTIKSLLVAMVQDGALQSQMRASVLIN